jgi:hypothetical protein
MATSTPRPGLLSRLLPASGSGPFFDLFEQHADHTREAAGLLAAMLRDGADPERQAELVKAVEHQGDEVTHTVIERLHQTFITPIDRDQIHTLINTMDDVADLIQDSAETMALYDVRHITEEIARLTDRWRAQGEPTYDQELLEGRDTIDEADGELSPDEDDLLEEAIHLVAQTQTASVSMIQRRLRVGYTRAGRLIDMLERRGVISGYEGSKPRQVLITEADVSRVLSAGGEEKLPGAEAAV